jgi:hypothetical protein
MSTAGAEQSDLEIRADAAPHRSPATDEERHMTEQAIGQSPSSAEIISALERTGFLLEQRAALELKDAGFVAVINDAFPDPDTGKSRELDLYGGMSYEVSDTGPSTSANVLIECKNTRDPYLVIGANTDRWTMLDESVIPSFDPLKFQFRDKFSIVNELDLERLPGDDRKESFVGFQLVQMNRNRSEWRADNSSVYDSIIYPLAKARQYHIDRNSTESDTKEGLKEWEFPFVTYYFPVLLTTAAIFTVTVSGEPAPAVSEVGWTTLQRAFNSTEFKTLFRMDVVNFASFHDYLLNRVAATVQRTHRLLSENAHYYDPEWLLEHLGQPRYSRDFNSWLEDVRRGTQER